MNIIFETQKNKKFEPKQDYETIFSHFFYNNQLKNHTHKTIGPNKRTLNNQFLDGYKSCVDHTPTFTLVIGHKLIDEQLSQFCPCRSVFHCYHIQYPHLALSHLF